MDNISKIKELYQAIFETIELDNTINPPRILYMYRGSIFEETSKKCGILFDTFGETNSFIQVDKKHSFAKDLFNYSELQKRKFLLDHELESEADFHEKFEHLNNDGKDYSYTIPFVPDYVSFLIWSSLSDYAASEMNFLESLDGEDLELENIDFEPEPETEAEQQPKAETKANILREELYQYGFFELEKIKTLSEQSKISIVENIAENSLPYAIAMFDYLQFISHLEKKHFDTKDKLNKEISKWFNSDKDGRAVRGNINSLIKQSTENKNRYTAHLHKEDVKNYYEQLK